MEPGRAINRVVLDELLVAWDDRQATIECGASADGAPGCVGAPPMAGSPPDIVRHRRVIKPLVTGDLALLGRRSTRTEREHVP